MKKDKFLLYIPIIAYLFIFIFLILQSQGFSLSNFFNGGDTWLPLRPEITIIKSFYMWEDTTLGRSPAMPLVNAFYALPMLVFKTLAFGDIYIGSFLTFLFFFMLIATGSYLLALKLSKNKIILSSIASFLYTFNLFSFMMYHTAVLHGLYLIGALPLILLFSLKYYEKYIEEDKIDILMLVIISVLFFGLLRVVNMFAIYLVVMPILCYILLADRVSFKKMIYPTSLLILLCIIISSPVLVILAQNHLIDSSSNSVNIEYSKSAIEISYQYKLIDSFRGIRDYETLSGSHRGTMFTYYFLGLFPEKVNLDLILSFSLVILALTFLLLKKIKISLIFAISLIALFFAKMTNHPFGQFNSWLYSFSPFLLLFRTAGKYMQNLIIFFIFLIVLISLVYLVDYEKNGETAKKKKKNMLIVGFIVLFLYSSIPFQSTTLFNPLWANSIPDDYYRVSEFLNSDKEDFKIMPLPITKHFVGYNSYTWNYTGPDILYYLVDHPITDKFHNTVAKMDYVGWIDNVSTMPLNEEYLSTLSQANIKYILHRKDWEPEDEMQLRHFSPTKNGEEISAFLSRYTNNDKIKLVFSTDYLDVYEIENYSYLFETERGSVDYKKISSVEYKLEISYEEDETIIFRQHYDPDWVLYCGNKKIESEKDGLFNKWSIDASQCNNPRLYYSKQKLFETVLAISLVLYLLIILIILSKNNGKNKIHN